MRVNGPTTRSQIYEGVLGFIGISLVASAGLLYLLQLVY